MFFQLNDILWEKERKKYCVYCVMRLGFYFCVFDWRTVFYVKVASAVNFVFFSSSILTCMHTWRTEIHLIKINITRWIMKPRPNTWWNLATGDIPKKYGLCKINARTVHHRFWVASYERLNIQSTKYKHKCSLDLDCFETKRNVDDVLMNVQYNIIIIDWTRG